MYMIVECRHSHDSQRMRLQANEAALPRNQLTSPHAPPHDHHYSIQRVCTPGPLFTCPSLFTCPGQYLRAHRLLPCCGDRRHLQPGMRSHRHAMNEETCSDVPHGRPTLSLAHDEDKRDDRYTVDDLLSAMAIVGVPTMPDLRHFVCSCCSRGHD